MTILILHASQSTGGVQEKAIILDGETDWAWTGKPLNNLACPSLVWPKYAWREIQRSTVGEVMRNFMES